MGYTDFKQNVCTFYRKLGVQQNEIESLKVSLDKLFNKILPSLEDNLYCQIRDFTNTEDLHISFNSENFKYYYSEENRTLMVVVIVPNWRNAYRLASKNENVKDKLWVITHFMFQYIYRAYQVNLIGAIALATNKYTDFRGEYFSGYSCEIGAYCTDNHKEVKFVSDKQNKAIQGYLHLINSLDPYVNRVIFYYVHAIDLYDKYFCEEAITSLDNMIDTVFQDLRRRQKYEVQRREELQSYICELLSIYDKGQQKNIERIYLLRCSFTAHPAKSKWWDFTEFYNDDIKTLFKDVRKFMIAYLKYENKHRLVEKNPDKWSEWIKEYSDIVFDAVW